MVGFLCLVVHSGFLSPLPDVSVMNVWGCLEVRRVEKGGGGVAILLNQYQYLVENRKKIREMLFPRIIER